MTDSTGACRVREAFGLTRIAEDPEGHGFSRAAWRPSEILRLQPLRADALSHPEKRANGMTVPLKFWAEVPVVTGDFPVKQHILHLRPLANVVHDHVPPA